MITRVVRVVSAAEKSGIRVDWVDRVIVEICSQKDRAVLAQQEEQLSTRVAELREELGRTEQQLGEVRAETTLRNFCPRLVSNDKICIIVDL